MSLLRFKAFSKMLSEYKIESARKKAAEEYKKVYMERLQNYGVSDASELDEEKLSEFLEGMKTYRKNQ